MNQKLNHTRKFNVKGNIIITLTIKALCIVVDIGDYTKPHGNRKSLCCLSSGLIYLTIKINFQHRPEGFLRVHVIL